MTKVATTSKPETAREPTGQCLELAHALERMPFSAELSFESLFRELEGLTRNGASRRCEHARSLIEALQGAAELRGTIRDARVLEEHSDGIRLLMSFVFPELGEDETLGRAHAPFSPGAFFTTRSFRDVFEAEDLEITVDNGYGERDFYRENLLFAYSMLYHLIYGEQHGKKFIVKRLRNTRTGLDRFFLVDYHFRFVDASYDHLELPPQREFSRLLDMEDLEELTRRVPLDGVVFSGFNYIRYVEVTEGHNLSLLKSELVEPGALNSAAGFDRILQRLRSILQVTDLDAGLTLRYRYRNEHRHCTVRSVLKDFDGCLDNIEETIYGEVTKGGEPHFVPDLDECECDSAVVTHLRARGVRSVGLIPLLGDGEVIGLLELTSGRPDELHPSAAKKLADLLPPLTMAAQREMDEVASRIERTIKANCTAIHPSVEWRFEDAAYEFIREEGEGGTPRFADILFENVHPLYGAMDIRGSSHSRSRAIQADLAEQLSLAHATMARIHEHHAMPIADYYDSVLARFEDSIGEGLSSGDEISIIEFLHQRVEPFFEYVREHMPAANGDGAGDLVESYYARLDPAMRILYQSRKDYEESVALINDTLGSFLDQEDERAQAIYPHYFEKFKTDGVEHNIYVGQSMTHGRKFDAIQLKNLRLWQLRLMCEKARLAESLLPRMKVRLRTTPLVLVQSSPLTIQFRTESKQFEVEGSYNVRYEIIKKRIDKSTVRGTGERLTQPGKLSVIYSQDKEGEEYLRYFEYLADKGFVQPEIERLDLEDLPGVHGLHALRAPIVLD